MQYVICEMFTTICDMINGSILEQSKYVIQNLFRLIVFSLFTQGVYYILYYS